MGKFTNLHTNTYINAFEKVWKHAPCIVHQDRKSRMGGDVHGERGTKWATHIFFTYVPTVGVFRTNTLIYTE